jgi:predicted transcriptional regulator
MVSKSPPLHRSVRAELRAAEVSQERVGAVLGLPQPAVSRRLRGITPWRADELLKVSKAFRISLDRLYNTKLPIPSETEESSDGEPSAAAS